MPQLIYEEDLARIHIDGYGFHGERAADPVREILRKQGITAGTVVDLGCGGGQWLQRLASEQSLSALGISHLWC